ncbi:MAG: hypothetical protein RBU30_04430, partial [Polyangia bacterium]|nr:hypothetical protein [Polyangia bacterium]
MSSLSLRTGFFVALFLVGASAPSGAAPGAGTLADPVRIDAFPYAIADDTTGRPAQIDAYACSATTDEGGPEVVYALTTPENGRLVAWVEGDVANVTDIDVHLISSDTVTDGVAVDCVARSNLAIEVDQLPAGDYFVIVDTYVSGGTPLPGPYVLRVDFIAYDTWRDRPVARGVTWRQKLYPDLFGYFQTVNMLVVDPADPDVSFLPVDGNGCETTASMGDRVGAVAAINAGFFDGSCN